MGLSIFKNRNIDVTEKLQSLTGLMGLAVMDLARVNRHFADGSIAASKLGLAGSIIELIDRAVTVEETVTNSTYAVDSTEARVYILTMSNDITFSVSGDGVTDSFVVILVQDGTGSRTPAWSGINWGDAGEPSVASDAGKATVLVFMYYDSEWLGFSSGTGF